MARYRYENISVLDVYDADTLTVLVQLGFKISFELKLRLARINAWEVKGKEKPKGIEARNWFENTLFLAKQEKKKIWIETYKDASEKFGRYLADVYVGEQCLNDELVKRGMAKYQKY